MGIQTQWAHFYPCENEMTTVSQYIQDKFYQVTHLQKGHLGHPDIFLFNQTNIH